MKTVLILGALLLIGHYFHIGLLESAVGIFFMGCVLFGVADFIHDCFDGYGFSIRGQMQRAASGKSWIKL